MSGPPALPAPRAVLGPLVAPHRIAMGLAAVPAAEPWLELDGDLEADLLEKRRLLREEHPQVFVEDRASRPAQREVRALLAETLCGLAPAHYQLEGNALFLAFTGEAFDLAAEDPAPLETASRWLQEDLCVMEARPAGWCLTAASVCFPTRWDLPSRFGLPMPQIHERVPGYGEVLAGPADRFFDRMKAGRVFRRANWSLVDAVALFQPAGKLRSEPDEGLDARNAGERVWLRVERQTMQRLRDSGAVLFTIRVHRTPLSRLAEDPAASQALLESIETMQPAMRLYKSLDVVRDAVEGFLRSRVAEEGPR